MLQLWKHALRHIAEVTLEGLSRVKGCTGVGRAAMTSDLQDLSYGLKSILESQEAAASLENSLRIIDTYIKVSLSLHRKWLLLLPMQTSSQ